MVAAGLMAVGCGVGTARGSVEVFVYNSTASTTLSFDGGMMAGVTYKTLGSSITFNSLGFIDLNANPANFNYYYGTDGLLGSYQVGIWINSAPGTLLASTTVTPDSTVIGNFRYAPIPATTIPAFTDFTIAALLPAGPVPDGWLINSQTINSPDIQGAGGGRILAGATSLSFPSQIGTGSHAIVNASTQVVVPEPTSTVCIGLALGGLAALRRRRAAANA